MSLSMNEFAARPVHAASALRGSFLVLGVIASVVAGKALLAHGLATPAIAEPAAPTVVESLAVAVEEPGRDVCRPVAVEIDEGYGVRGHVTRWVCHKTF